MTEVVPFDKKGKGDSKPATPIFRPDFSENALKPAVIKPLLSAEQKDDEPPAQGIDLSEKPKIILTAGRGKTGKTLFLRWMAETAQRAGHSLLMADTDPTNATFSAYFEQVARPNTLEPALVREWVQKFIQFAAEKHKTAVIDFGGGDTVLRSLVEQTPHFDAMLEEAGVATVMFYLVGPQPEDLTPAATLAALNFKPRARAFVLNQGIAESGLPRRQAFARVLATDVYREETSAGAITLWMPRLFGADAIEARTASFVAARDGETDPPLGIFNRSRVHHWLQQMDEQFSGVRSWIP